MINLAQLDAPLTSGPGPEGKFSLAGAQAKIALHRTPEGWSNPSGSAPSTHIIKPAIQALADQDLVEVVTMRTAGALGLSTATTDLMTFGGTRAVVVTRYDRVRGQDGSWSRVHQEDMCQALGIAPFRKYESQGVPVPLQSLTSSTGSALIRTRTTVGSPGH